MKVYIITAGDYSEYHIEYVFIDKDKAEKYTEIYNEVHCNDEAQVEVFDTEAIKTTVFWFSAWKDKNGVRLSAHDRTEKDEPVSSFASYGGIATLTTTFKAMSRKRALKIAEDRFTQYEAREAGL